MIERNDTPELSVVTRHLVHRWPRHRTAWRGRRRRDHPEASADTRELKLAQLRRYQRRPTQNRGFAPRSARAWRD
jgi:hypothetical protein